MIFMKRFPTVLAVIGLVLVVGFSCDLHGGTDGKRGGLYPEKLENAPGIASPFTREDGLELVTAFHKDGKYVLIPVTVTNGYRKGRQIDVDGEDFPTLARTGIHADVELARTKTITGKSVTEITDIGRPGRSSNAGFMAEDEDIISVLLGDNEMVRKLGLRHPQLAKPLFHVWNMIIKDLELDLWPNHSTWDNFDYILYNGRKVTARARGGKGGQGSIFNDEMTGAVSCHIGRQLDQRETDFLAQNYSHLTGEQMEVMIDKLSHIYTGEMEPYYIQRYGFYEGHTEYRTDPAAISFIFGLKSIEEIEHAFPGKLYETLTAHFTRDTHGPEQKLAEVLRGVEGGSFSKCPAGMPSCMAWAASFARSLSQIHVFVTFCEALAKAPPLPPEAGKETIASLIEKLEFRGWEEPVKELVKKGEAAVDPLIEALNSKTVNRWISERVCYAIGGIGTSKAVDALIAAMKDSTMYDRVRASAVEALGYIQSEKVTDALLEVVKSEKVSDRVLWFAVDGLGRLKVKKAEDALIEVLKGNGIYVKAAACRALAAIKSAKAVDAILAVFKEDNWRIWEEASAALVEIGEPAVGELIRALKSEHSRTRRKAAWVLGKLRSLEAVEPLLAVLEDSDWMVREEAAVALDRIVLIPPWLK